jgi:hypothetical protein
MLVKKCVNFITTLFIIRTWFGYKLVYSQFATTHYMVAYKTIHIDGLPKASQSN